MHERTGFTESIAAHALREGGATVAWNHQEIIEDDDAWFFPACPDDTTIATKGSLLNALETFTKQHDKELAQKGRYLGVWHDPASGKFHIDINTRVKDRHEAIEKANRISAASSYKIKAIFNLRRDKTIEIEQ